LRRRQPFDLVQDGRQKPVERGVAKVVLRLEPREPQDLKVGSGIDGVIEQSCLADAGIATNYQRRAATPARPVEERIERCDFVLPTE
jgi:hypothetical protein